MLYNNLYMLYNKIISESAQIHTKHTKNFVGRKLIFNVLNLEVHKVTIGI